jgi:hypothetical protein
MNGYVVLMGKKTDANIISSRNSEKKIPLGAHRKDNTVLKIS